MNVCALILAGGFSSRMAPLFKPLLPLPFADGAQSALAALCARYLGMGIHALVVGGYRAEEIRKEALAAGASFALNPRPEKGMLSSVCAGIAALPQSCSHFFVQPADIPLVRKMTLETILEASAAHPDAVLLPAYRGRRGHPPLFPASVKHALSEKAWSGGLREAMAAMPCAEIPCADSLMLRDMDAPDDYADLKKLAPGMDILDPEEAMELLEVMRLPGKGKAHARAVGAVAKALALCLPGISADLALVGGLVHDVCKGEKDHEAAAGRLFRRWGMERMAWMVESHNDIALLDDAPFSEREIVFLADKFVSGSRFTPVEERYGQKLRVFAGDADACSAIRSRLTRALRILERFERESGRRAAAVAQEVLIAFSSE